jgi:hypothetical protein
MNIHSANISSAKPIPVARHSKPNVEEIKFATEKANWVQFWLREVVPVFVQF